MRTYLMIKGGGIVSDRITAERARELYDEAAAADESLLTGDLASGFGYFTTHKGVRLVRVRVERAPAALGV